MSNLENLESTLMASRKVSAFLQSYTNNQWVRVLKAMTILGIQYLEKCHGIHRISNIPLKHIEDMVVLNEEELLHMQVRQKEEYLKRSESEKAPFSPPGQTKKQSLMQPKQTPAMKKQQAQPQSSARHFGNRNSFQRCVQ